MGAVRPKRVATNF